MPALPCARKLAQWYNFSRLRKSTNTADIIIMHHATSCVNKLIFKVRKASICTFFANNGTPRHIFPTTCTFLCVVCACFYGCKNRSDQAFTSNTWMLLDYTATRQSMAFR